MAGGRTRNESTRNGLLSLDADDDDVVVVHDAVRPLVPIEVIVRAIEPVAAGTADSTDTVIPSADTLVIVEGDRVVEIPDRSRYRRGQTPQVFRNGVLVQAYEAAAAAGDLAATDDCSLVLRYVPGARVVAVAGDEVNLKITTRIDLVSPIAMLQMRTVATPTEDPGRPHSLDGRASVRRRRHERDRPRHRRGGAAPGRRGRGRWTLDGARRARLRRGREPRRCRRDPDWAAWITSSCTAGVLRIGPVMDTEPADLAEVIDVNLTGTLNVARAAYPHLRASAVR